MQSIGGTAEHGWNRGAWMEPRSMDGTAEHGWDCGAWMGLRSMDGTAERSKSARTSQKLREQRHAREPHERARTIARRRRTLMPSTLYQHSASSTRHQRRRWRKRAAERKRLRCSTSGRIEDRAFDDSIVRSGEAAHAVAHAIAMAKRPVFAHDPFEAVGARPVLEVAGCGVWF
jgi:hypothetical protein